MENQTRPYTVAIIVAGGSSTRFSAEKTKQKIEIDGISVLRRTLLIFDKSDYIDEIVLAYRCGEEEFIKECISGLNKKITFTEGGRCRAESVRFAFNCITNPNCAVMIHDGARCLITDSDIESVALAVYQSGAATAALRVTDTVKRISDGMIAETLDRSELITVATPQAFSYEIYNRALEGEDSADITDDNMRVERLGIKITPVFTSKENIKITTKEDIELAEFILKAREKRSHKC